MSVTLFIGNADQTRAAIIAWAGNQLHEPSPTYSWAQQHHYIRWYDAQNEGYKRASLDTLLKEVFRTRDSNAPLLIILESIQTCSTSSANSLLKLLEEPPAHVLFALSAPTRESVLPTIASRALIKHIEKSNRKNIDSELASILTTTNKTTQEAFTKALERSQETEKSFQETFDAIFEIWFERWQAARNTPGSPEYQRADRVLKMLTFALEQPPMPGSQKHFWRNIYLLTNPV